MPGGAIEAVPLTRANSTYDLTRNLGGEQKRDGDATPVLYGGYYLDGGFTAPEAVIAEGDSEPRIPAYNGANWTWTEAQTENGMAMHPEIGKTYYIKEVPADMYLQPYFHYTYKIGTGEISTAWLISDIDDSMYVETGFVIESADNTAKVCSTLTVQNKVGGASVLLKPENIFRAKGVTRGYLSYLEVITDYENVLLEEGDRVVQYWVTPDGLIVTGTAARTFANLQNKDSVKDGVTDTTVASTIQMFESEIDP